MLIFNAACLPLLHQTTLSSSPSFYSRFHHTIILLHRRETALHTNRAVIYHHHDPPVPSIAIEGIDNTKYWMNPYRRDESPTPLAL
jgi:hypothetical protein